MPPTLLVAADSVTIRKVVERPFRESGVRVEPVADHTFRIRLGPMDTDSFNRILPGQPRFDQLSALVRMFLDQPLDWELELLLDPAAVRTVSLGDRPWARLGHNTWTFAGSPPEAEFSARLSGRVQELGIPFPE